jgi:hypothetical protein
MSKQKKTTLFINASHPFPLKNRCAHCGSNKLVYYQDYTNPYWYPNTRYARDRGLNSVEGWLRWTGTDYTNCLLERAGERFAPTHSVAYKRYSPKFNKSWAGVFTQRRHHISNMVVVVVCEACDLHTWVYMNSTVRKMPENSNRKARINCPQKIAPLQWRK